VILTHKLSCLFWTGKLKKKESDGYVHAGRWRFHRQAAQLGAGVEWG
jgi:hypothetical protein